MKEPKFKLGNRLKCVVTGFTGIAIARLEYLNGCTQYGIKPKVKAEEPGKMPDAMYIDQQQLELVDDGISVEKTKDPGGDVMPDAPGV